MVALSGAGKVNVAGLIIAAVGILTLFATGFAAPQAFIGIGLLIVVAALILFGPWKWTTIIGVVLPLFLFVAALISPGFFDRLTHPSIIGAFVGTSLQALGLVIAIIAGSIATFQNYRTPGQVMAKSSSDRPR